MPKAKDNPELNFKSETDKVEEMEFEPIQGYPMLHWRGKRPYKSTRYYPAQLKEVYGQSTKGPDGKPWLNRIYWGDNREVMSHLLRKFRGKVDLVYIDPPFDSKAEYKKTISLKGKSVSSDHSTFEEKQYTDIWTNDEYLQFMYERLVLLRELLSEQGSIYLHCDWHKSHLLRCLLDEIFGQGCFVNEISRIKSNPKNSKLVMFGNIHDAIYIYRKTSSSFIWNELYESKDTEDLARLYEHIDSDGRRYTTVALHAPGTRRGETGTPWRGIAPPKGRHWAYIHAQLDKFDENGYIEWSSKGNPRLIKYADESQGNRVQDIWTMKDPQYEIYPTEKSELVVDRIIKAASNPGSIVFDCFMGSGTTQAVAMKLGRRFIGADINLGAIHTTVKRLNKIIEDKQSDKKLINDEPQKYFGFQVYHVNNYEIFKNPVEARALLVEALELDAYPAGHLYDGQKDGRQYKIMPVNHIASKFDLNELITGFDQRQFAKRHAEAPNKPVEKITLVCMGHEPDLAAHLKSQFTYSLDVEVVDILRDRQDLEFKRDSVAKVKVKKGELIIERFYPQNLLQKLSLPEKDIEDWRQLVETVAIDWNYTGEVMAPAEFDNPGKNELVKGRYKIPGDAGRIRLKITDLIAESLEMDVEYGQD